eukprot:3349874-Alexandrium_andersonii.AAC.1
MKAAGQDALRVAALPRTQAAKARMVRAKVHGKGLYAVEVTPVPQAALSSFQAACKAPFLNRHASGAAPALVFTLAPGFDPDPEAAVTCRRILGLRRAWWRLPEGRRELQASLSAYVQEGEQGTRQTGGLTSPLPPAPPPARAGRAEWPSDSHAKGPLGLLLAALVRA